MHLSTDEKELNNSFWADVFYYMEDNNVSKEESEKAVYKIYVKNGWFQEPEKD